MSINTWKEFEIAVAQFLKSLGNDAKVIHDTMTLDKDTNKKRQRDVWIEGAIAGFPIRILCSCKDWNRKLDVSHIDSFCFELQRSTAHKGVIYSKTGFTENALKKAEANEISCCQLYKDEAPLIPDAIIIKQYHCRPKYTLKVSSKPSEIEKWSAILDLFDSKKKMKVIDILVNCIKELEKQYIEGKDKNILDKIFSMDVGIKSQLGTIELKIFIENKFYESKLEAILINGSFDFVEKNFIGYQTGPTIDMENTDPGGGWHPIPSIPRVNQNIIVSFAYGGKVKESIMKNLYHKRIT